MPQVHLQMAVQWKYQARACQWACPFVRTSTYSVATSLRQTVNGTRTWEHGLLFQDQWCSWQLRNLCVIHNRSCTMLYPYTCLKVGVAHHSANNSSHVLRERRSTFACMFTHVFRSLCDAMAWPFLCWKQVKIEGACLEAGPLLVKDW